MNPTCPLHWWPGDTVTPPAARPGPPDSLSWFLTEWKCSGLCCLLCPAVCPQPSQEVRVQVSSSCWLGVRHSFPWGREKCLHLFPSGTCPWPHRPLSHACHRMVGPWLSSCPSLGLCDPSGTSEHRRVQLWHAESRSVSTQPGCDSGLFGSGSTSAGLNWAVHECPERVRHGAPHCRGRGRCGPRSG